jgi:hypothetical protein
MDEAGIPNLLQARYSHRAASRDAQRAFAITAEAYDPEKALPEGL